MKKNIGLFVILILLLPCLGFSDSFSFRFGYYIPHAKSDLWEIEFENMNFTKSNFQSLVMGFAYERFLTKELSLVIGVDMYSKMELGDYRDFVGYGFDEGEFAFPADYEGQFLISHQLSVSQTPIQASLKLSPLGRKSRFAPYIGGGISVYIWSVKLQGDMIDFDNLDWVYVDPDYGDVQIYPITLVDAREETKLAFGFQGFAGFMIPIARRLVLETEFKYYYGKANLGDAFEGFGKFDLSSFQVSLGINYWF